MSLAGYLDRDKENNRGMSNDYYSDFDISYGRKEKIYDVTPVPKEKKEFKTICQHSIQVPISSRGEFSKLLNSFGNAIIDNFDLARHTKINREAYAFTEYKQIAVFLCKIFNIDKYVYIQHDFQLLDSFYLFFKTNNNRKLFDDLLENFLLCRVEALKKVDKQEIEYFYKLDTEKERIIHLKGIKKEIENKKSLAFDSSLKDIPNINVEQIEKIKKQISMDETEINNELTEAINNQKVYEESIKLVINHFYNEWE